MGKLGKWWGGLSSKEKFVIVLILVLLIWVIRNSIQGAVRGAKTNVQGTAEIIALQANGIKQSYSDSYYDTLANKLETAIKGWGTDEQAVYSVFDKLNNNVDFIKLEKAFSVRESQDMREWLKGDLDTEEIKKLNARLKANGITKKI